MSIVSVNPADLTKHDSAHIDTSYDISIRFFSLDDHQRCRILLDLCAAV